MMQPRPLNWFGWSIETRAAISDSYTAAKEAELGLVNNEYIWSAFRAEQIEQELDAACAT